MGMTLGLTTISDETIEKGRKCPPLLWKVLAPDDPECFEQELASFSKPGFFARLFTRKPAPKPDVDLDISLLEGEGEETSLDKAWHGIHFLLTGKFWEGNPPFDFLLDGGVSVFLDTGYNPPHMFHSTEVAEIYRAIKDIHIDDLRNRFNPEEMMKMEIYPTIWDRNPQDVIHWDT